MTTVELSTDYLVIGSGTTGMAFADVIVQESDFDIIIVDMHGQPGGHWNDAYPFVTLHQPSTFYGVSSLPLGNNRLAQHGFNEGMGELATGAEVTAYFEQVMRTQLLPSGRVRYFPKCRYTGEGQFESMLTGQKYHVTASARTVDATALNSNNFGVGVKTPTGVFTPTPNIRNPNIDAARS
ncbi:NAD(P)-binding protein [Reinekea sp.]|uniref:NAD(P)-binding protein n=1 Tax=Reinekea sp. TaxID=1970455 RepID=UPI00257E8ACF|nr:NAD(P)-binding protein [Reinekea sp.]